MVSCDTAPPGPCDSMECVRYSPTASSTAVTGPSPPRFRTSEPLGALQPLGLLPQAMSEVSELPARATPEQIIKAAPATRVRQVGKCIGAPGNRVLKKRRRMMGVQPSETQSPF